MSGRKIESTAYKFKMAQIFNFQTGKTEPADFWLSKGDEVVHKLRYSLRKNKKSYGCPFCKTPVILRKGGITKKGNVINAHFAHTKREEGVKCHLCDLHNMTDDEVKIQRYNQAKESEEHIRLKGLIYEALLNDPKASDVKVEKIKRGSATPTKWKRPDVQCVYNGMDLVFEVQISNTWLSDIVERDTFYQQNNTYIIWVFNQFDSTKPNEDVTRADIFYNNPEVNLFVFDEKAQSETVQSNRLSFSCHYRETKIDRTNDLIQDFWVESPVEIDSLKYDFNSKKPYFYNYQESRKNAEKELNEYINKKRADRFKEREKLFAQSEKVTAKEVEFVPKPKFKIEDVISKKFSDIKDYELVELIFENKRSRNINSIRNRILDLREMGFSLPDNLIDILEEKEMIRKMTEISSLLNYERK